MNKNQYFAHFSIVFVKIPIFLILESNDTTLRGNVIWYDHRGKAFIFHQQSLRGGDHSGYRS